MELWFRSGVFAGRMIVIWLLLLSIGQPALAVSLQGGAHVRFQPPIAQLIVKFKAPAVGAGVTVSAADFAMTPTRLQSLSAAAGIPLTFKRAMSGNAQVVALPYAMNQQDADVIAARLRTLANVQYAEPDRWLFPATAPTPDDPQYASQWHLTDPSVSSKAGAADLPGAWNITTGSSSVVVGVIDTGVLNHADLAANLVGGSAASSGYDMIYASSPAYSGTVGSNDGDGRDSDPTDPGDWEVAGTCGNGVPAAQTSSSWHGTHVSGIIGAVGNNSMGVTGINWHTSILMVRALGVCGGMMSDIEDALTWAAGGSVPGVPTNAHPAKVINMSIGGSGSCGRFM